MYKDFEDWWENSGIKETDSYCCIEKTYKFTKENIPQAFESFARNCYTSGAVEGIDIGKRYARGDMVDTMLSLLDMLKIPDDIKTVRESIKIIEKNFGKKIKKDNNGIPVERDYKED